MTTVLQPASRSESAVGQRRYDDPVVLAQLAGLRTMPVTDLKEKWRTLVGKEPPPYNRKFIESRLAYRIQELAFGGLRPETRRRLAALAEELEQGRRSRRGTEQTRPVVGTRLVRDWQGEEHTVTVTTGGYEWEGRPYRSLSAVARAITGTRWNGWTFFGLKGSAGRAAA